MTDADYSRSKVCRLMNRWQCFARPERAARVAGPSGFSIRSTRTSSSIAGRVRIASRFARATEPALWPTRRRWKTRSLPGSGLDRSLAHRRESCAPEPCLPTPDLNNFPRAGAAFAFFSHHRSLLVQPLPQAFELHGGGCRAVVRLTDDGGDLDLVTVRYSRRSHGRTSSSFDEVATRIGRKLRKAVPASLPEADPEIAARLAVAD